ncbi:MAG TPA: hypothetical protein EYP10_08425 [Armatimonadetes bacterium]|nr:hypothetical protein [Armatimonadota bacterium]
MLETSSIASIQEPNNRCGRAVVTLIAYQQIHCDGATTSLAKSRIYMSKKRNDCPATTPLNTDERGLGWANTDFSSQVTAQPLPCIRHELQKS